jgi:hypothetical protein
VQPFDIATGKVKSTTGPEARNSDSRRGFPGLVRELEIGYDVAFFHLVRLSVGKKHLSQRAVTPRSLALAPQCIGMDSNERSDSDHAGIRSGIRCSRFLAPRRHHCHFARSIVRVHCRSSSGGARPADAGLPGYPTDGDLEAARLFIRRLGEGEEPGPFGIFEILEGPDDEVVGGIGFHRPPGADGAVEVGYGIVPSRWNQGICTDALRAIVAASPATTAPRGWMRDRCRATARAGV